jgi:hypothetical protein
LTSGCFYTSRVCISGPKGRANRALRAKTTAQKTCVCDVNEDLSIVKDHRSPSCVKRSQCRPSLATWEALAPKPEVSRTSSKISAMPSRRQVYPTHCIVCLERGGRRGGGSACLLPLLGSPPPSAALAFCAIVTLLHPPLSLFAPLARPPPPPPPFPTPHTTHSL